MSLLINKNKPLHLFEGFGVELEYIIVNRESLDIMPISDRVLRNSSDKIVNELVLDGVAWSNELALHIIEIKTAGPAKDLSTVGFELQRHVEQIDALLEPFDARLMPGAAHPWMDPFSSVELWPHEYNPIYEAYNRIFDCSGHGWSNVQSTHLNLPFYGEQEFEKLHAALRLVLPLIPAMAASSPIADSERKPFLDFRMEMYRTNAIKIPSITGLIIPEAIFSKEKYQKEVLDKMYREIAPYDPDKILQEEWLNSRGLMPRWDRNSIEVRVMDVQECPTIDLAILEWVVAVTKMFIFEDLYPLEHQRNWHEDELYPILLSTIEHGEKAVITDQKYLNIFGLSTPSISAGDLCEHIFREYITPNSYTSETSEILELIFEEGPLARRILNSLPQTIQKNDLVNTYHRLCECLKYGKPFIP
ncbi:carboxylate-amine ligase [Rhodohalobacter barkolensis]|uniref:Glutamate--cysteine ligase n=1 Tax=Rhodohalobacter barkolensis TaxID=2053187 RepID=A0A2N0VH69_9BACT|nr:glutamate-cysteine ligase family protein [Rhodohalobacter barkolensis]PKD43531.1 glutamate--cysteine ligase [Rhodohalobacter barkolensis]